MLSIAPNKVFISKCTDLFLLQKGRLNVFEFSKDTKVDCKRKPAHIKDVVCEQKKKNFITKNLDLY